MVDNKMKNIVECVPNISEGRNEAVINQLRDCLLKNQKIKLLNVESNIDYNRTVFTFVGDSENIVDAAYELSKMAIELIDMSKHKGVHPRLGAVDVVPFIPIANISMDECVNISIEFAKRISKELLVPIYLYENSSKNIKRKNLSDIRKGEYEGLSEKIKNEFWKPDYGQPIFNKKSGAIITGARNILIAYNVNLKTDNVKIAKEIAKNIRESGGHAFDANGKLLKDDNGNVIIRNGLLKTVKAIGVYLDEFNISQVSTNITDYKSNNLHQVYEAVKKIAKQFGVEVTGSELIGLAPLEAFLIAGKYYSQQKILLQEDLINCAVENLGLNDLQKFIPQKKIIEYII